MVAKFPSRQGLRRVGKKRGARPGYVEYHTELK